MSSQLYENTLSVEVDASDWDSYTGGIKSTCGTGKTNHAVQVVGMYRDSDTSGYWYLRNSWGTSWGDKGYMYLKMFDNLCYITKSPIHTSAEKY